jgi:hypothetical protein
MGMMMRLRPEFLVRKLRKMFGATLERFNYRGNSNVTPTVARKKP